MMVRSYVRDICERIKGKKVLDVGCCATTPKNLLKRHNEYLKTAGSIIGVDNNKELLKLAKTQGATNIHYADMTIESYVYVLQKDHGLFEAAITTDVIEHVFNAELFLSNIYNMLEDNGLLYITTPNMRSVRWMAMLVRNNFKVNPDHVCWYDEFTLSNILKSANFKIVKIMYQASEKADAKFLGLKYKDWMARRLYIIASKIPDKRSIRKL